MNRPRLRLTRTVIIAGAARRWRRAAAGAAALALPLAVAAAGAGPARASSDPALSGISITINNGPGDATQPSVSGEYVSYTEDATGADVVHYYNLATGTDASIPGTESANDSLSGISGPNVVYVHQDSSGLYINSYNISTGNAPVTLDPGTSEYATEPAIGGDTVAWADLTSDPSVPQIMVYNTVTQTVTDLSDDTTTANVEPAVSPDGSVVVWAKCTTAGTPCNIWEGILGSDGTWSIGPLTSGSNDSEFPQTDGNIVVYQSVRSGEQNIYWQPVGGGTEQQISITGTSSNPHSSGGLISFEYTPAGGTASDIDVYSLATQTVYQLTNTPGVSDTLNDISVTPDGVATVVWQEQASPNDQLYGFVFQVPQAAQAISFTAPAAGVYGGSATLSATGGGSGNPVTFSVDPSSGTGVCTVSGDTVSYTGAGSCVIDANQAGTIDYTAAPQVTQIITVSPAAQSISFTAPATGIVGMSATLTATGGGSGNPVVFTVDGSSGAGVCNVSGTNGATVNYTAAGSCVIDANQAGNANYTAATQVQQMITVDQAPAFVLDSPPLTAVAGQQYGYTFEASGTPAPGYALASGAPSWLSVNASTGQVTGTPPSGTTSFSYAVIATNAAGTATAGPFTVTVTKPSANADISAVLSCPAGLTVGGTGTCTLTVANAGPATATKVVAGILLPPALSETSCTPGCARHANVFTWTLASLASGASAQFAITVKASAAGKVLVLAAAASQNPDPNPLNNITVQQITITR